MDTRVKEGEGGVLDRGELEEEAGSPKSGRYGLWGVFMTAMPMGMDEEEYVQTRRLLYLWKMYNTRNSHTLR